MTKSRKIDEIYRERLNNVETTPPADSWQNISNRLPQKKKRRIFPVWYALAGTAAAIALFFTLYNYNNFNDSNKPDSSFTYENTNSIFSVDPTSESFEETMKRSSNILEAAVLETRLEILKAELKVNKAEGNRQLLNASERNNRGTNRLAENNKGQNTSPYNESDRQTQISSVDPLPNQDKRSSEETKTTKGGVLAETKPKEENSVMTGKTSEEAVAGAEEPSDETVNGLKKNSQEAIAEAKVPEKPLQQNELKEEISVKHGLSNRFSITPTAAAVYFDNFGSGNILDDQFANQESSGEISMSYGVNLAYQLSEKFKIRSGISKVDLAYNTLDVNVFSVLNSQAVNVNSTNSGGITSPENNNEASALGALNQRFGFIEVPLEMEYTIINRKIGLGLIGGLSTLILEENGVSLNRGNLNANVGEANNINEMSFSANLGIGLDYNIAPRFKISLEPILKYQINTFKNTSNLHPYYFGIYSGLSYKF